jgi:hypothetical protein
MSCRAAGVGVLLLLTGCSTVAVEESEPSGADGGSGGAGGSGGSVGSLDPPSEASDACAAPTDIDLSNGPLALTGDTRGADDEHPDLTCESPHVAFSFDQGQRYYRFEAEEGRTYDFSLTPSFYGFLYVFPESVGCTVDAIQAACSSDGESGMVSPIVNPGTTGRSSFLAPASERYVIGVDGDTSEGPFELVIEPP